MCVCNALYVYTMYPRVHLSVHVDYLEKRACKISKGIARVHGAPYSPVRSRRRDLQVTWEFLSSRLTEFLSTFPRAIRISPYGPCWRSEDVTRDDPASSTELTFRLELPGILISSLPLSFSFSSAVCRYTSVRYSRADETALCGCTPVYLCETTDNEIRGLIAKPFRTLYGAGLNASQAWELPVEWNWTDNSRIVSVSFGKSRIMTANSWSTTTVATDSRWWKRKTDVW